MPKLDLRRVCALRQIDANRIAFAVGVIVFAKLVAQPRRLHAHDRIDVSVEGLGTIENLQSDVVALQPFTPSGQGFIDDIL